MSLTIKYKTIKLLDNNIEENLQDVELGEDVLDQDKNIIHKRKK